MRKLTKQEISNLISQGCTAEDWTNIQVGEEFNPQYINNVEFYGSVTLGSFQKDVEMAPGFTKHSGIRNATLRNVVIGNDCLIEHVGNNRGHIRAGEDYFSP